MKITSLIISVVALTIGRLIINLTRRFAYPFLPAIARELSVPLASVQSITAVQGGMGVISPLFGPLSERYGRKRVLMGTMLVMIVAAILGALLPQFWLFAAVMITFGLGVMIFAPVTLAYLGDNVPYQRRGRAIGFNELSWAGSLIIAAPVAGFLLDKSGLQAVFVGLGLILTFGLFLIWYAVPADHPEKGAVITVVTPIDAWRIIRRSPAALGALGYSLFLAIANEMFFINYGAWMEESFRLDLASLGAATTVIALAEIVGEFGVIGIADRFGKKRLALSGAAVSCIMYLVLPNFSSSLPLALIGLFIMFWGSETAIVAGSTLFTEVLPGSRSVMMSSNVGAASIGRLTGALLGSFLYAGAGRFILIGGLSTAIALLSLTLLWRYVQDTHGTPDLMGIDH